MKIVIIDDEDRARQTTISMVRDLQSNITIAGEAASVHEGIAVIEDVRPDLVLLDIQMRDGTGFDLLDKLGPLQCKVIFTTGFDQFALKAFRYHAVDYLLKPIDPDLLKEALDNVIVSENDDKDLTKQIDQLFKSFSANKCTTLALPSQNGIDYIHLDEINYLMAEGNYTTFFLTDNKKIVVTKSIKDYEDILPPETFFRVHQSYIVRSNQVKRYSKDDNSIVIQNGDLIPVARRRRNEFMEWLAPA
jgi:two-component system, LytTR family, response regulator